MKYLDEYRSAPEARRYVEAIERSLTRPWTLMEVCGGQTHAIVRFGIDEILPPAISLLHGPGCPVCVTPLAMIDRAIEIARRPGVVFCSYGDMLRVPGSSATLFDVKAEGGDVRIVYSAMDALALAEKLPGREIVFFAVGFETTAPAHAMAVHQAKARGLRNFSMLVSHVRVPPALEVILGDPERRVHGLLAAGHVCTIMGTAEYEPIARRYRAPIVVTGFEPLDILQGVAMCVRQLEEGRAEVENQYSRAVRAEGNAPARHMLDEVFCISARSWRGLGEIDGSGLALRPAYADHDAEARFGAAGTAVDPPSECISGAILRGLKKPTECPAFGVRCSPDRPLGATMVSSEGACAAYFRYRRRDALAGGSAEGDRQDGAR
jgi:hydrogenase expression/formation protein HypD